jgi:hypothetical protein
MIDFRASIKEQLEPFDAHLVGDPLASLMAIKGRVGKAERTGGAPFSGDDGLALDKAFGRLGWGFGSQNTRVWCGVALALPTQASFAPKVSRPIQTPPVAQTPLAANTLRLICEIIDPLSIVALDDEARLALIAAFESAEEGFLADFTLGSKTQILGRQLISVGNFEDALTDETNKQIVWAQLKQCAFSPMEV